MHNGKLIDQSLSESFGIILIQANEHIRRLLGTVRSHLGQSHVLDGAKKALSLKAHYSVRIFGSDRLQAKFDPELSEALFMDSHVFKMNDSFFINEDNQISSKTPGYIKKKSTIHIFYTICTKNPTKSIL